MTNDTELWSLGERCDLTGVANDVSLTLFPRTFPVRWNLCSTIADFCTSYLATRTHFQACRDAINYVLNELVENAVKFSNGETINISLGAIADTIFIVVENHVDPASVDPLHATLEQLVAEDPLELMMRRVEENAEHPEDDASGLGFLTMMTDYQAAVCWRLTLDAEGPRLQTIARLDLTQG